MNKDGYLYSQRYSAYANEEVGRTRDHHGNELVYRMKDYGCAITDFAMLLSYFNSWLLDENKPFYPDQMLDWLKHNGGLTTDGCVYWEALCKAAGGKLRHARYPWLRLPGELTFGIRSVAFGPQGHYIIDDPVVPNKIIDPWDGLRKDYIGYGKSYRYTGDNHFYFGRR